jgi:hypothetical protein
MPLGTAEQLSESDPLDCRVHVEEIWRSGSTAAASRATFPLRARGCPPAYETGPPVRNAHSGRWPHRAGRRRRLRNAEAPPHRSPRVPELPSIRRFAPTAGSRISGIPDRGCIHRQNPDPASAVKDLRSAYRHWRSGAAAESFRPQWRRSASLSRAALFWSRRASSSTGPVSRSGRGVEERGAKLPMGWPRANYSRPGCEAPGRGWVPA